VKDKEKKLQIIQSLQSTNWDEFLKSLVTKEQKRKYEELYKYCGCDKNFLLDHLNEELEEIICQSWVWISTEYSFVFDSWESLRPQDSKLCLPFMKKFGEKLSEYNYANNNNNNNSNNTNNNNNNNNDDKDNNNNNINNNNINNNNNKNNNNNNYNNNNNGNNKDRLVFQKLLLGTGGRTPNLKEHFILNNDEDNYDTERPIDFNDDNYDSQEKYVICDYGKNNK
jgi:hypothetical protein